MAGKETCEMGVILMSPHLCVFKYSIFNNIIMVAMKELVRFDLNFV
jgi:hypothetical protein